MRRIVTFGLCALAVPMLVAGQTKDNFEYWDTNQNGDLTCSEAKDGPDGGLRLPAYEDDRDGTGIIYQWLERSRSSDTDNDGVACESTPNAGGYVPNVQPVEPQGCPADAETWRGLQICEEQPREGYDRDAFGSAYSSLEDDIIDMLPSTMKAGGQVYTPCPRQSVNRDRRHAPRRLPIDTQDLTRRATPLPRRLASRRFLDPARDRAGHRWGRRGQHRPGSGGSRHVVHGVHARRPPVGSPGNGPGLRRRASRYSPPTVGPPATPGGCGRSLRPSRTSIFGLLPRDDRRWVAETDADVIRGGPGSRRGTARGPGGGPPLRRADRAVGRHPISRSAWSGRGVGGRASDARGGSRGPGRAAGAGVPRVPMPDADRRVAGVRLRVRVLRNRGADAAGGKVPTDQALGNRGDGGSLPGPRPPSRA